jgi:NAD+ kinase
MAAGGPIVEPTARNLLLTPICPHSTRSSSYVLSPEHIITVEAADANRKFVYLSVDGGKAFSLKNGDQVRVSTSKYTTRLVRLSKKSFCEILDKKMGTEASKK